MNPFAKVAGSDDGVSEWGHEFYLEKVGSTVALNIDGNEIRMTQAEALKLSSALRKIGSEVSRQQ